MNNSFDISCIGNTGTLPQLSHTQLNKLKHLTILTIAAKCKVRENRFTKQV